MKTFLNIRGTNGSGKSTLARKFFGEHDATIDLCSFKTKSGKTKHVTGRINPDNATCVVGDYSTMAGGLDKVPTFALQFEAIEAALALEDVETVVAEGVLASTVLGSWAEHALLLHDAGHRVVWVFMTTPLEVCLQRIYDRNGGKPFKESLVADKLTQIDRVRQRAECRDWIDTALLPYQLEWSVLLDEVLS
jgi:predicted kinase